MKLQRVKAELNVQLTSKLIPLLLQQKAAAIVNVSSGLAIAPKKFAPIYCATKAVLHLFTMALRCQLESTPIKVFEIIPPVVDTAVTKGRERNKISPEALAAAVMKKIEAPYPIRSED